MTARFNAFKSCFDQSPLLFGLPLGDWTLGLTRSRSAPAAISFIFSLDRADGLGPPPDINMSSSASMLLPI